MNLVELYIAREEELLKNLFSDEDIYNKTFLFYGVCGNEFKLNEVVFEAEEDPDDGYRSYLDTITVKESDSIFSRIPLANVRIEKRDDEDGFDGYYLIDTKDNHIWLEVGTDHTDSYYPTFTFSYNIKKNM